MIGYGEGAGSGFPLILEAWRKQGWRLPDISENRSVPATDLRLWTLPSVSPDMEQAASQAVPGYDTLSAPERNVVLTLLIEEAAITERFSYILGMARAEAHSILIGLRNRNMVQLNPANKWVLAPAVQPSHDQEHAGRRSVGSGAQIQALLALRPNISTQQIMDSTGWSRRSTQRILRKLLDEGSISKARTGNAVTYALREAPQSREPIAGRTLDD